MGARACMCYLLRESLVARVCVCVCGVCVFCGRGRFVGEVPRMLFILYTISILLVPSILATAMPIHYLSALLRFAPMTQL